MDTNINQNQTEVENKPLPLLSELPFAQFFQKSNLDTINDKINGLFSRWRAKWALCAKVGSFSALVFLIEYIFSDLNWMWWPALLMVGGSFIYWFGFKRKEAKKIITYINQLGSEDKIIIRRALSIMMLIDIHKGQRDKDYIFDSPEYFLEIAQKDDFNLGYNKLDIDLINEISDENSISDFLQKEAYQQLTDAEILQMIYSYLPKLLEDKISQYQKIKERNQPQLLNKEVIIEDQPENLKEYL